MSKEAQNNPIDTVVGVLDDCIGRIHDWFGCKGIRLGYSILNARNVAIKIQENLQGIGTPAGEPNFAKDLEEIRRRLSDFKNEQIKQRLKVIEQRVVDVVTFTNYPNASPPSALLGNMKEELEGLRADLVCWTGEKNQADKSVREQLFEKVSGGKAEDNEQKSNLKPICEKAYQSYFIAEKALGQCTDKQAYDWLKEQGNEEYDLPSFDTWGRQLRTARKHYGTNKNNPRAGRAKSNSETAEEINKMTNKFLKKVKKPSRKAD